MGARTNCLSIVRREELDAIDFRNGHCTRSSGKSKDAKETRHSELERVRLKTQERESESLETSKLSFNHIQPQLA